LGRSYTLKGRILERMGKLKEALATFQKSLICISRSFSSIHFHDNPNLNSFHSRVDGLHNLEYKNRLLLKLYHKDPNKLAYFEAAKTTNQLTLNLISQLRKTYSDDLSKLQLLSKANPIYEMGLELSSLQNQISTQKQSFYKAFKISEQGKSMILQDHMRSAFALQSPDIPADMKRKEDSLRVNIDFYGRRIDIFENRDTLSSFDSTQYQNSQRIYLESEEAYEKLMKFFEANYEEYARRKGISDSLDVEQLFTYLEDKDLCLIEYFEGEKLFYVFSIYQGEIKMFELPKTEDLMEGMRDLKEQVSNASEVYNRGNSPEALEAYATLAHRLYQAILAPMLHEIPTEKNLVIIPDGLLNVFPFEVLLSTYERGPKSFDQLHYLIEDRQIQYALSAKLLMEGYSRKQLPYDFLGYAPQYEGQQNLDFNEKEIHSISGIISGKALIGKEANKENFLAYAGKGRYLHLAQHAINAEDPMMSHLLFSEDKANKSETSTASKLYAYEVYAQKIPCELAVLNACETGQGKLAQGEGMLSLSRAFRYAGAGSVIMNKWAVNDESSFRILSSFYQKLLEGQHTAEALRNAKLTYLKNSNKTHPYFWAGTSLIGASTYPNFNPKNTEKKEAGKGLFPTSYIFWFLVLCFLLALIFHLFRRVYPSMED
ncbi:MAG: CHAT domain-containing protein, partial [Bacteroidota bacterium]